jgi:hypothetical protein
MNKVLSSAKALMKLGNKVSVYFSEVEDQANMHSARSLAIAVSKVVSTSA